MNITTTDALLQVQHYIDAYVDSVELNYQATSDNSNLYDAIKKMVADSGRVLIITPDNGVSDSLNFLLHHNESTKTVKGLTLVRHKDRTFDIKEQNYHYETYQLGRVGVELTLSHEVPENVKH